MSDNTNENKIPYVIIRKDQAKSDRRLLQSKNGGRKVFAITLYESREKHIEEPEWRPGHDEQEKTPIVVTGRGGLEVATFNQLTEQELHKHLIGTEIYTVLDGEMEIIINEKDVLLLGEGDEIVILPGTAHEILTNKQFLVRVHCIDCHGVWDKYIKVDGDWKLQSDVTNSE